MLEKLLENWLDSASERSYQAVFVQMLSAEGYRVVHSTRHTALEFGKDVLAIAPDGVGCAYQLKGHPGSRLGLNAFRNEIQAQLVQLMSQAIVYPGFPPDVHRSYLVSNGFYEEEVQRAVDDLNRAGYRSTVALISRGDLLDLAKKHGMALWPSELDDTRMLLELFLANPRDSLPLHKLSALATKVLALDSDAKPLAGWRAYERAATSAALLTGIATSRFTEVENHHAVIGAWTLFAVSTIAAAEKYQFELKGAVLNALDLAEETILDTMLQLWDEVAARKYLVESNALADPEVYGWRNVTLLALFSCLALLHEESDSMPDETYSAVRLWLLKSGHHVDVWGEGALAQLVPWLVWLQKHEPTMRSDFEVASFVRIAIEQNQRRSSSSLASPYYTFEEIARANMGLRQVGEGNSPAGETFAGASFTARPLFHLLVRTNLKQTCKELWPAFSKLSHRESIPDNLADYCGIRFEAGLDRTKIYPLSCSWNDLKTEATQTDNARVPLELAARPWLLGLWWQLAPYRFTTESSRVFANSVLPNWGR